MVSRNPYWSSKAQQTTPQSAGNVSPANDALIAEAHALYGSDAAYCGLDAWFEGEEVEFRRFARLFRRLRN